MTARTAIDHWNHYRDGNRITAYQPDELTLPQGEDKDFIEKNDQGPYHYGFLRVEEAIGTLCKLRSQRETINQLLRHVFANGKPVSTFNGANFRFDHVPLLQNTIDAVFDAVEIRLKAVPPPKDKVVEIEHGYSHSPELKKA